MSKLKLIFATFLVLHAVLATAGGGKRDFDVLVSGSKAEPRVLACRAPEFSFHLPQMAGNFRLGLGNEERSSWGSDLRKVTVQEQKGALKSGKNKLVYSLRDPLLGGGTVTVKVAALSDSDGIVAEVTGENIPEGIRLFWSFGGCYGKTLEDKTRSSLEPAYCKYNVFSVEGTAFTTYYGESMKLKVIQGVTPMESEILLSDAHRQQTPGEYFRSGKKTDAPALGASVPLGSGQKLYFCFYTQNDKADYNYYMLPELFQKEFGKP